MIVLFQGCRQSYIEAQKENNELLEGRERVIAEIMVEINDYYLLFEKLSKEAEKNASSSEIQSLASTQFSKFNTLRSRLNIKAVPRQVTLPDKLSTGHMYDVRMLKTSDKDQVGDAYVSSMKTRLKEMQKYLESRLEDPVNDFAEDLCSDQLQSVRKSLDEFKS